MFLWLFLKIRVAVVDVESECASFPCLGNNNTLIDTPVRKPVVQLLLICFSGKYLTPVFAEMRRVMLRFVPFSTVGISGDGRKMRLNNNWYEYYIGWRGSPSIAFNTHIL